MKKTTITLAEAAAKQHISSRRMRVLCDQKRVVGARKNASGHWQIPLPLIVLAAPIRSDVPGKIKARG